MSGSNNGEKVPQIFLGMMYVCVMGEEMRRKEGFCGKAAILNYKLGLTQPPDRSGTNIRASPT